MTVSEDDLQAMVAAIMAVSMGLEHARRQRPAAGTLAVLQGVATREGVRPSELATALGVHLSSITRQVRVLADTGYVLVTPDPDDGRSYQLALTAEGREELRRLTAIGMARFATFIAEWDAEEVQTFTRLLLKFEASKSAVGEREQRPVGRPWQQKP